MLNSSQQDAVQSQVQFMSDQERAQAKERAISLLENLRCINYRPMSQNENELFHLNVEILMRIEALEQSKGLLFRLKRRLQLTAKYLPSVR